MRWLGLSPTTSICKRVHSATVIGAAVQCNYVTHVKGLAGYGLAAPGEPPYGHKISSLLLNSRTASRDIAAFDQEGVTEQHTLLVQFTGDQVTFFIASFESPT
ncbi:hypothetical protein FHL15_008197 [Xylaria flabelliformis]|uniref:Uncharacterized protein n=1 Tax=Xylaria flabelliformis TaxID=2512241 RepID=A0A553HSR2_9PEZI|nr:hypothetical protein FHL15_008197 [Xylaria flabelliformis]